MNQPVIHNLDEEFSTKEYLEFTINKGTETEEKVKIDITFIPAGCAIPIENQYSKYQKILQKDLSVLNGESGKTLDSKMKLLFEKYPEKQKEHFEMLSDITAILLEFKDSRFTKKWILENWTLTQVAKAARSIMNLIAGNISKYTQKKTEERVNVSV